MTGEIRWSLIQFYDIVHHRISFKRRPALFIAKADKDDYVVLPVSRITRSHNIDPVYDIRIDPADYPKLKLPSVSYVRTHKQIIVHAAEMGDLISNMKKEYPDLYLHILVMREEFSKEITSQALD